MGISSVQQSLIFLCSVVGCKNKANHGKLCYRHYKETKSVEDLERYKKTEKAYRKKNRKMINKLNRNWRRNNPNTYHNALKRLRILYRFVCIWHYSKGKMCCVCCGEKEYLFLTIEHLKGEGKKHRDSLGGNAQFYPFLVKSNFPEGYSCLCMNCNFGKRMNNGRCPHDK